MSVETRAKISEAHKGKGKGGKYGKRSAQEYQRLWRLDHLDQVLASNRRWWLNHRDNINERVRERNRQIRKEALQHYGGRCACCGEEHFEFLSFDHINGGGNKHRRIMRIVNIALWLKREGYPDGFRVLCHNCNFARGHYGSCPHQSNRGMVA